MTITDLRYLKSSDLNAWIYKYRGLPFKHLGEDKDGIDCFNLVRLVYKEQLGIDIPYTSSDYVKTDNSHWYQQTSIAPVDLVLRDHPDDWQIVSLPVLEPFDVISLSIGSTNCTNHTVVYVGSHYILNIMHGYLSNLAPYGRLYQQYTTRICRWKQFTNN